MAEFSHNIDFVDQRFLAVLLTIGIFLRECFDCIILSIFMIIDKINCGEISFADLLDWFEQFMEASHVDFLGKSVSPCQQSFLVVFAMEEKCFFKSFKLDSIWFPKFFVWIFLSQQFEDKIIVKVNLEFLAILFLKDNRKSTLSQMRRQVGQRTQ